MKLFVIAALIAVSAAARLEHLEQQQNLRAYLPPYQTPGSGRAFGAIAGAYGTAGSGQPAFSARSSFPSASNKYLPPNQGLSTYSSGSAGTPDFAGSIYGFGPQSQQYAQQPSSNQYGQQNSFGAQSRYQSQQSGVNRQYLAPHSSDNVPQQAFDEQTGYHY